PILTSAEPPSGARGSGAAGPTLACAAILAIACLAARLRRGLVITLPALALLIAFFPAAGCGGGGGGGNKQASGGSPVAPAPADHPHVEADPVVRTGRTS